MDDGLVEDMTHVEEPVSTLESNLDSVKSVLQSHLGEAEGKNWDTAVPEGHPGKKS